MSQLCGNRSFDQHGDSRAHRSLCDYLAGTVVVHDPDRVVHEGNPGPGQLKSRWPALNRL